MGLLSAEIRWWGRDAAPPSVVQWFDEGPCDPGGGGRRIDRYLDSGHDSVGIKYRGGSDILEIKSLIGERPLHRLPLAHLWVKHSLAFSIDAPTMPVAKRRWLRLFECSGESVEEIALGRDETPINGDRANNGCEVELVEVARAGGEWWSVCFEGFGTLEGFVANLTRTLDHLAPLPEDLIAARHASYPEWLNEPN